MPANARAERLCMSPRSHRGRVPAAPRHQAVRGRLWCVPRLDDEYVARMEDILALYEKPLDPRAPRRVPRREAGAVARAHPPRERARQWHSTNRRVSTTRHRQRVLRHRAASRTLLRRSHAEARTKMLARIAGAYPDAETIHLVVDNLNTHRESSLLEAMGHERGTALWARFDVHYTPKHASWLNQAEIAISMLTRECLARRRLGTL